MEREEQRVPTRIMMLKQKDHSLDRSERQDGDGWVMGPNSGPQF